MSDHVVLVGSGVGIDFAAAFNCALVDLNVFLFLVLFGIA